MSRSIYRYDPDTGRVEEVYQQQPGERVHIINDKLADRIWIPCFKKDHPLAYSDSKSTIERRVREAGCYVVGNDTWAPTAADPNRPLKLDVKGAWERAKRSLTYKNDL